MLVFTFLVFIRIKFKSRVKQKLLFFFLFSTMLVSSQDEDFGWWNDIHDWDGITPWNSYINVAPGTMGPNALPVPEMRNGFLDTFYTASISGEMHLAENEFVANAYIEANIPIKNAVSMQVTWYPYEYFITDTTVRDFRAARTKEAKGSATGDLYIATVIPIVQNHAKWPDILIGINLKTATGNRLEDARYTDSPGYYFDASFGKSYTLKNGLVLRPHAMGGFYVYQTHDYKYVQNDAIMWGVGLDLVKNSWLFKTQLTGYSGYFNYYDSPVVFRAQVSKSIKRAKINFRYQVGNNSYNFHSLRLGVAYNFSGNWN
jgi:hypothetical protein